MVRAATVRKQLEACPECTRQGCSHGRRPVTPSLSRQSKTCVRKTNKKPIIRFYPAIKLVNDHFKKVNGNGVHGPHRLRLRQNGKGRKRGGPLKSGKTINDFSTKVSFTRNGDSLVSDGWCKQHSTAHVSHTHKHFLACGSRT